MTIACILTQKHACMFPFRERGLSRDMLVARKSMLQSELDSLNTMVAFNMNTRNEDQANRTLQALENKLNSTSQERDNKTRAAASSMAECMSSNANLSSSVNTSSPQTGPVQSTPECNKFQQANSDAVTATFNQAQVRSEYESAAFLLNTKGQFNDFLSSRANSLQREIASIDVELNASKPYLGGVADSKEFRDLNRLLNNTEQNLDDAWTAFEYNSDSSHVHSDQETKSTKFSAGFGVGAPGFGIQVAVNHGKGTADLKQALNSANLKVSGELLRVVIKRPWFKPSIFQDPSLSFVSFSCIATFSIEYIRKRARC